MADITLTNSLTRRKSVFQPISADDVRIYVCGPTVYDRAHLGNARPVVVFDVLFRLLRHVYGCDHVTYARNFTDVDDKINARAAETGRDIRAITDETIEWYHSDMDELGALRPTFEPRATEYIAQMTAMIDTLISRDHAYAAEGHVLFDVRSYESYGKLSGRSLDDMIAGARVEVAPFKRDPMDFVLWKPSTDDQPGWDSPWGRGRPGWHIECSAMAAQLLGDVFDIHAGGIDLQFPHHENEIAQSTCAHGTSLMAQVWLHNEMVQVEGRKMSKSLGNFFTVRDLLDQGIPGPVIRFVLLMTHYRKPMDWTADKAREASRHLARWASRLLDAGMNERLAHDIRAKGLWLADEQVVRSLSDDLNTAGALARLHQIEITGSACDIGRFAASLELLGLVSDWDSLAQLRQSDGSASEGDGAHDRIEALLATRSDAKRARNFALADQIRLQIESAGVTITDQPDGISEFRILPGFDEGLLP